MTARARLLRRLADAEGQIVTYEALLSAMWPRARPRWAMGTLRVLVYRLREKMQPGAIRVHRGIGYQMPADVAATVPRIDARV